MSGSIPLWRHGLWGVHRPLRGAILCKVQGGRRGDAGMGPPSCGCCRASGVHFQSRFFGMGQGGQGMEVHNSQLSWCEQKGTRVSIHSDFSLVFDFKMFNQMWSEVYDGLGRSSGSIPHWPKKSCFAGFTQSGSHPVLDVRTKRPCRCGVFTVPFPIPSQMWMRAGRIAKTRVWTLLGCHGLWGSWASQCCGKGCVLIVLSCFI